MNDYEIRAATAADAAALYRFGEALLAETSFFLRRPGERAGSVDEMRMVVERFAALPHYILLNAWRGPDAVGEAVVIGGDFSRNRYTATVGVGVLAAHAAQGVGRALMHEIESFARERRLHRLELTVMAHNSRARALYAKMGYVEEGVKRGSLFVDGAFVDEVMMAKVLG